VAIATAIGAFALLVFSAPAQAAFSLTDLTAEPSNQPGGANRRSRRLASTAPR